MPEKLDRCVTSFMGEKRNQDRWPDPEERKRHAFAICNASLGLAEASTHMGYLVDLSALQFEEGDEQPKWIHVMPVGTKVNHPRYGELDFTAERIQKFHDNHERNVRGVMLDIDYEHKEGPDGGRAAGWIVKTQVRDNGLWALVDWTKKALNDIKNKAYKYFSPEFDWTWTDPNGNTHENVLFGGALTNRPFLKNLVPINLSERIEDFDYHIDDDGDVVLDESSKGGEKLDLLKKIAVALGLKEDASEEDVLTKAKALTENTDGRVKLREALKLDESADDSKIIGEVKKLMDFFESKATDEAKAKKFSEMFPEEAKQLEEQRMALQENTVNARLEEWTSGKLKFTEEVEKDGKKESVTKVVNRMLPPKLSDPVREFRLGLTGDAAEKFDKILTSIIGTGLVSTADGDGSSHVDDSSTTSNAAATLLAEAKKYRDEQAGKGNKISLKEATRHVVRERPELAESWQTGAGHKTGTED